MVLKPFWNYVTKDASQKLFLPKNENFVDVKDPFDDSRKQNRSAKSWVDIKIQNPRQKIKKNFFAQDLLKYSQDVEKPIVAKMKAKKIRLFPNKEEEEKLRKWFGCYRCVYNKGVKLINKEWKDQKTLPKEERKETDLSLTNRLNDEFSKDKNYEKGTKNDWMMILPADTRSAAILELIKNRRTNLNSGKAFELHFKSKKQSISMPIRKRQFLVKSKKSSYRFLRDIKRTRSVLSKLRKKRTSLPEEIYHSLDLQLDKYGNFYLIFKENVERNENQVPKRIISIDPGVRTFLTGYTDDGEIYHIGAGKVWRLDKIIKYRSYIQSLIDQEDTRAHKRNHLKRRINKLSFKLFNLVEDMHKKLSTWLLKNFEYVIIPKLNTGQLVRKYYLTGDQKNRIKVLRHCSFIERLKFKINEYPNTKLIIPTEEYTSKTCTGCGWVNYNLRSEEIFKCIKTGCKLVIDRDVNGARNILLKYLTELSD
jgi:transposase